MAFILTVLKLIGILLAVVIALVCVVMAVVLIMPLGYELSGEKYEKIKASAFVKWLFGIIRVEISYDEEELIYSLKLFGKTVYPKKEKETEIKVRGGADKKEESPAVSEKEPADKKIPQPKPAQKEEPAKKVQPKETAMAKKDADPKVTRVKMPEVSDFPEEEPKEKMTLKSFVIGYIKDMPNEDKKKAVTSVLSLLKGMIKHILPKDLRIYAVIGTDDPSVTGYILAASGIARGFTGKDILVQGDFENKRAEGEVFVKGRIRLGALLYMIIRLLLTRPIRKFIIRFIKVRGELV
ncbi:MAG: hypothetical protein E7235_05985 [Lachnospiraceae bacterium]|nr:hypothetical protein [Lachnospiraceae bacterium]